MRGKFNLDDFEPEVYELLEHDQERKPISLDNELKSQGREYAELDIRLEDIGELAHNESFLAGYNECLKDRRRQVLDDMGYSLKSR